MNYTHTRAHTYTHTQKKKRKIHSKIAQFYNLPILERNTNFRRITSFHRIFVFSSKYPSIQEEFREFENDKPKARKSGENRIPIR